MGGSDDGRHYDFCIGRDNCYDESFCSRNAVTLYGANAILWNCTFLTISFTLSWMRMPLHAVWQKESNVCSSNFNFDDHNHYLVLFYSILSLLDHRTALFFSCHHLYMISFIQFISQYHLSSCLPPFFAISHIVHHPRGYILSCTLLSDHSIIANQATFQVLTSFLLCDVQYSNLGWCRTNITYLSLADSFDVLKLLDRY